METKIETGVKELEHEHEQEEEIAKKIKAGVEEEGFYRMGFERQKRVLMRIKFEESETIRMLVHNIMERYGDEGLQLLKYVDFDFEKTDEKNLVEIVGELESIPIIRESKKLINRLIEESENVKNEDKNEIEVGVDWERQYREEAKQRQTIEAELKTVKSKYEGVLSILQKRAPLEKKHSERETKRIFEMIEKKDLKKLTKALSKDPSLIFVKNEYENTLLHEGVLNEWIEGIEVIIEYGVGIEGFIDRVNEYGETALMKASYNGSIEVVKFLVSKGANIEAKNNNGETALIKTCWKRKLEIVEFLISKGANIEAKDNIGRTALMWACFYSNLKVMEFLISKGANIETKDNKGWTLLMYASKNGIFDVVKFLISKGLNIEEKNNDGETALMYASKTGNPDVVKFLISKGANIKERDNEGKTALMWARDQDFPNNEVVKFLESKGAK